MSYICRTDDCDDDSHFYWCYSTQWWWNKEYQTTLVKSLKVSSLLLEEQKCPKSYFPSRIVDFLKYLATITTFVNISSPVKTWRKKPDLEIAKKSTRNTMNNEHNDAECKSVDKIEILETIYDPKNYESEALDAINLILELKRKKLILQEIKDQEEKLLQAKKAIY